MGTGREGFLDLVYETAAEPTLWPSLVGRFAELVGGSSAAFRSYDMLTEVGTVIAAGQDSELLDHQFRAFTDRNPIKSSPQKVKHEEQLRRCGLMTYQPGMTRNTEWLPQEDFVRTEYYNEVYRTLDIYSDVSVGLAMEGTTWTGIDVYRGERIGQFTARDLAVASSVIPHLVRALKLSRKLSEKRSVGESLIEVFDRSSYGLILLDRMGQVRHVNATAQRMAARSGGPNVVAGRLVALTQDATHRLHCLIDQAAEADPKSRSGGSIALPRPGALRPLSVIVAPIRAEHAFPLCEGPAVMVCITDLDAGVTLPEQHVRELFSLTPSEARLALTLFEGFDPRQAADHLDLSITTVRTQLRSIFAKTETSGQVELARVMLRTLGAGFL